jgi:hypothetical protein
MTRGKPRTPKKPVKPRRTVGARALHDILLVTTPGAVAARCRVSTSSISLWLNGKVTPSSDAIALLERNYNIAPAAWHTPYSAKTY